MNGSEKRQKLHVSTAVDMAFQVHQGLCMIFLPLLLSLRPHPPFFSFGSFLATYCLFATRILHNQSLVRVATDGGVFFFFPFSWGEAKSPGAQVVFALLLARSAGLLFPGGYSGSRPIGLRPRLACPLFC